MGLVSGTKNGSRMMALAGWSAILGSSRQLRISLAWSMPTMLSRVSRKTGMREWPDSTMTLATSGRSMSSGTQSMSVRGVMVSCTCRSLEAFIKSGISKP